jgi:polyisoprenoid-binding protein YceI
MKTEFNKIKWQWASVFAFTLLAVTGMAQVTYAPQGPTKLTIAGTSTMHDWTMTSTDVAYTTVFETNEQGKPTHLVKLSVSLPAESLKSGKSAMDKNAYAALKTDKNKTISFNIIRATIGPDYIKCTGKLSIAGTIKEIDDEATYVLRADNSMQIKGSRKITMTDYGVEPPSFMFGSVKTGDEITVSFDVILAPKKTPSVTLN